MSGSQSTGGLPPWMTFGSAGFAAVFGAMLLSGPPDDADPKRTPVPVVGAQHVPFESRAEQHRVSRMRAPLMDFLGIAPPQEPPAGPIKVEVAAIAANDRALQLGAEPNPAMKLISPDLSTEQLRSESTRPISSKDDLAWRVEGELKTQLEPYDLQFLVMTVSDPIDSGTNYFFDRQIDALLKALAADPEDRWLYCAGYLPWQAYKDHRTADPKTPLLREKHWYQDEPGVLLFRNSTDDKTQSHALLLVYLVGELPTLGLQRDAMEHALHDICVLDSQVHIADELAPSVGPLEIPVIGPTFTGGAYSLRESMRDARKVRGIKLRAICGSATGIPHDYFDTNDYLGATLCGFDNKYNAIRTLIRFQKCAWLIETGTAFSDTVGREKDHQPGDTYRSRWEQSDFVFSVPAGISRVRGGFEQQLTAARKQAKGLQPLRSTAPLPFDADEFDHDFPAIQTPQMSSPGAELVLGQILRSISGDNIPFVAIVATDVRDTIFLAEILKLRCPHAQLLILEPDVLLTHPEYADSLRGAIVASGYPLFPEALESTQVGGSNRVMQVMGDETSFGTYNAVLLQRCLQRRVLELLPGANIEPPRFQANHNYHSHHFVGLIPHKEGLAPHVWLHTIGNGRFFPLNVVPRSETERYTISLPFALNDSKQLSGRLDPTFRLRIISMVWLPCALFSLTVAMLAILLGWKSRLFTASPPAATWNLSAESQKSTPASTATPARVRFALMRRFWQLLLTNRDEAFLRPLFQFSSNSVQYRHWILRAAIAMLIVIDLPFIWFSWQPLFSGLPSPHVRWLTEATPFSGVSLLPTLFLAGIALVGMCYMKLRQSFQVSDCRLQGIEGAVKRVELGQLWLGCNGPVEHPGSVVSMGILGVVALLWTLATIFFSTYNMTDRFLVFWLTWGAIAVGYFLWWFAALELFVFQVQLRAYAEEALVSSGRAVLDVTVKELHDHDLRGVNRLLFGAGPGNRDAVATMIRNSADCPPVLEALSLFRNIQFRMVILKNHLGLLAFGAVFLFLAVVSYPFTSGQMLNALATITILALVIGACLCFWKLETDRYLSTILGTTPNEVQWDWGTIFFFGRNILLAAIVLLIQFVPGTWFWLGSALGPFSHLGK
jgi:hypothetical protein